MLTKEQADKIKAVISKDAVLSGHYSNSKGEHCVIAGLASAVGFEMEGYGEILNRASINTPYPLFMEVVQLLGVEYGLSLDNCTELQTRNDSYDDLEERRASLLRLVDSWVQW